MGNCVAVTQMGVTQAGKDEVWVLCCVANVVCAIALNRTWILACSKAKHDRLHRAIAAWSYQYDTWRLQDASQAKRMGLHLDHADCVT